MTEVLFVICVLVCCIALGLCMILCVLGELYEMRAHQEDTDIDPGFYISVEKMKRDTEKSIKGDSK